MIDPKQLMIGNLILDEQLNICRMSRIPSGEIFNSHPEENELLFDIFGTDGWKKEWCTDAQSCNPIPLSGTVLEACGFEKNRHEWFNDNAETGFIISEFSDGYAMSEPCKKGIGIMSLHLLQNLYFIITGQPLEIDIDKLKNAINGEH